MSAPNSLPDNRVKQSNLPAAIIGGPRFAERERLGITPQLMRLSVGIDDPEDVMVDLERGLIP